MATATDKEKAKVILSAINALRYSEYEEDHVEAIRFASIIYDAYRIDEVRDEQNDMIDELSLSSDVSPDIIREAVRVAIDHEYAYDMLMVCPDCGFVHQEYADQDDSVCHCHSFIEASIYY